MKVIPYGKQHITDEDSRAVVEALKSDFLTQGPKVDEFEKAFASYVDAKYAVAVSNGTAALHLSALAMEVGEGQKVITSPITFVASANCVLYCGGDIVFSDIDPATLTLDIDKVRTLLESSPQGTYAGVIPVDFTGYPTNLEEFRKLADEYSLWIIEDACHAPGGYFTTSHGVKSFCGNGEFADLAIFSFHPVKHIAAGEGGMITTNSKNLYEKLRILRSHGITKEQGKLEENHGGWYYEMQNLGYNYRLTDFQSALGISQLKRANEGLARRQQIAERYDEAFTRIGIVRQSRKDDIKNAFHLYVIEVDDRKGLYNYLRENNVYTQVHYIPVHFQPYYKKRGWKKGDFPVAESYYDKCLSLPMFPTLTECEQKYVIEKVISFLGK